MLLSENHKLYHKLEQRKTNTPLGTCEYFPLPTPLKFLLENTQRMQGMGKGFQLF